jgi:sialic acid synthase SpsE
LTSFIHNINKVIHRKSGVINRLDTLQAALGKQYQENLMDFTIGNHIIGPPHPVYFIELERAKRLIHLAKDAGADAAKFQHFQAPKIVSEYGFTHMNAQVSHQAKWKKSVTQVYTEASVSWKWTPILKEECDKAGIDFFTSPYDYDSIEHVDPYILAYKVGSGEIDWIEALEHIASKGKPVIIATGAANIGEVQRAVHAILRINKRLCIMQCNTNYTANQENYDHINLNVLKTYATMFPEVVLGLSDHTHENATVLGAVTLGARMVERHFTDDNNREGPDHKFALDPDDWAHMVEETRLLERALGSADKYIAGNEQDTQVVQRRCLRASRNIMAGEMFTREMIDVLRPATPGAIKPNEIPYVIGTKALTDILLGKELRWTDLGK